MRDKSSLIFKIYIILVLVFLFMPIFIIILFSFNDANNLSFPMNGLSLRWYIELINNRQFINSLRNSVLVAFFTSLISVALGTLASFALNKYKFKLKNVLSMFYIVPMTLPGLILGISLLTFLTFLRLRLSLITVSIGHIVFCTTFVLLIMNSRLEKLDFTIEEAAMDLGANPFQVFMKVTLPLIKSSLIGSMLIAFALSFDEFVVTFFIIGAKNTLPLLIWGMMRLGVSPVINAISAIITIISISLIFISMKVFKVKIRL